MNIRRLTIALVAALASGICMAETIVDYEVMDDEFGSGKVHSLALGTTDTGSATLFVSCFSAGRLQMQLTTRNTIFPDGSAARRMWVNVTHKVDTAPDAATNEWRMNLMKYRDAWLAQEPTRKLVSEMLEGERLSLRLDLRGTIYRFDLAEAQQYLPNILESCPE